MLDATIGGAFNGRRQYERQIRVFADLLLVLKREIASTGRSLNESVLMKRVSDIRGASV
jgi:hypothetical protein